MSRYLELAEKELELGVIAESILKIRKKRYEKWNKKLKESNDIKSERKLTLINKDEGLYMQLLLLRAVKVNKLQLDSVKGWVVFIGVVVIISLLISFFAAMSLS